MQKTEGRPINQTLLIEAAIRERKFFKLYRDFRPNLKVAPIAPKFYARHQAFDESLVKKEYVELIERELTQTPKEKLPYPVTESQKYGWNTDPLIDNAKDFRLNFRSKTTEDIKLACEMQKMIQQMRTITKAEVKK